MRNCKRCSLKTVLSEEDIQKAVERVKAMKGVKLVDEESYLKRYSICKSCDKLEYGSTCMMCGCIMQVRARLSDGKCPKKLW